MSDTTTEYTFAAADVNTINRLKAKLSQYDLDHGTSYVDKVNASIYCIEEACLRAGIDSGMPAGNLIQRAWNATTATASRNTFVDNNTLTIQT